MAAAWDFMVAKSDLRQAQVVPGIDPDAVPLAPGQSLLAIERFALTANNITYGVIGEQFGYWRFFPAPDGLGRIPVWGYARVVRSENADVAAGLRLFGYLPMSSHFTASLKPAAAALSTARRIAPACRRPTTATLRSASQKASMTIAPCCDRCS